MALGGDAVFRLDDGRVAFAPLGAPEDVADVEILGAARGVLRGRLAGVVEPGPGRVPPPCPFFLAGCGGCQWQQLAYATQLEQKQHLLRETLRRLGKLQDVPLSEPAPAPAVWAYRDAVQLHVDAGGAIGFTMAHSHQVVPVDRCLIAHPLLNDLITALNAPLARAILRDRVAAIRSIAARVATAAGQARLQLVIGADGGRPRSARRLVDELQRAVPAVASAWLAFGGEGTDADALRRGAPVLLAGEATLPLDVGRWRFFMGPRAFFQVNSAQARRLVDIVRDIIQRERPQTLLDLFCGVGLFSVSAADLVPDILAVEAQQDTVDLARQAWDHHLREHEDEAVQNGRVRFVAAEAEAVPFDILRSADLVMMDPPRSGLPGRLIDRLVAAEPPLLLYISCEPSTLARDLRRLTGAGWQLSSVQLVDLFPQTYHIESVSVLRRLARR